MTYYHNYWKVVEQENGKYAVYGIDGVLVTDALSSCEVDAWCDKNMVEDW
jgi:hypothetical protein